MPAPKKYQPAIKQHTVRQEVDENLKPMDPILKEVTKGMETPKEEEAPVVVVPTYVTEYEVRLRSEDMPLVVSVDGTEEGKTVTHKVTLNPNKWTVVPLCINELLRTKFAIREDTRWVPDAIENQRRPHGRNDETIMREEARPGYIIEFREHQIEVNPQTP